MAEIDSGDKIRNLKIDGKSIKLSGATQSSGAWTTTAPSYDFDGVDDYIDLGGEKPSDLTGDITISAWINPVTVGETAGRIIDNGKFLVAINSSQRAILSSDNSTLVYSATDDIQYNTWQHVLFTRNAAGDETNCYIDGVLSGTANQDSGTPSGASLTNTFIGNREANDRTFNGQISGVKVWSRILSVDEINSLYNRER